MSDPRHDASAGLPGKMNGFIDKKIAEYRKRMGKETGKKGIPRRQEKDA